MKKIRFIYALLIATMLTAIYGCEDEGVDNDDDGIPNTKVEEIVGRHMVGEALLSAHFVAVAERAGMTREEINAVLSDVAEKSAIDEFWITDSLGHAYLTNTGADFTFSPDSTVQPQAWIFWGLLDGTKNIVIQEARVREIDDRVFKYVGVAGIDKPRIVQVGISGDDLFE